MCVRILVRAMYEVGSKKHQLLRILILSAVKVPPVEAASETGQWMSDMCQCNKTHLHLSGNYHISVNIGQEFLIHHLENEDSISMTHRVRHVVCRYCPGN